MSLKVNLRQNFAHKEILSQVQEYEKYETGIHWNIMFNHVNPNKGKPLREFIHFPDVSDAFPGQATLRQSRSGIESAREVPRSARHKVTPRMIRPDLWDLERGRGMTGWCFGTCFIFSIDSNMF